MLETKTSVNMLVQSGDLDKMLVQIGSGFDKKNCIDVKNEGALAPRELADEHISEITVLVSVAKQIAVVLVPPWHTR